MQTQTQTHLTLTGREAVEAARRLRLTLSAYGDALSDGGEVTVQQAEELIAVDPSLVYLELTPEQALRGVEIRDVEVEAEESDDVDEGAAYWVTATVAGLGRTATARLYAAPTQPTGRLAPCGDSRDAWLGDCLDVYGAAAAEIGREVIARARV